VPDGAQAHGLQIRTGHHIVMSRVKKQGRSSVYQSHLFPNIEEKSGNQSQKRDAGCDRFRPLFQNPSNHSNLHADDPSGTHDDPVAEAQMKSFERGVEAGKSDASDMAQKELEPLLKRFVEEIESFCACFDQATHNYATHIVELSVAIAEKIMGCRSHPIYEELDPVRVELESFLKQDYQLTLPFHSQERKMLYDFMKCQNLQLGNCEAVQMMDEDQIQKPPSQEGVSEDILDSSKDRFIQKIEDILFGKPTVDVSIK
jgi:hypothetical protein